MTDIERQDIELQDSDFEELAAFIDGRLSGERKARMEQRLLFDEDLYEVFLETVRFREQDGGAASVTPHPRAFAATDAADKRPRFRRWWGPAAALAAAAVVAFVVVLPRGERSAADWASLLPPGSPAATYGEGWDDAPWSRTRSEADCQRYGEERCAFRLGAEVLELEVALRAGDAGAAARQATRISDWASGLELYFAAERYENLRDRLVAGAPADELRTDATLAEASLAESLAIVGSSRGCPGSGRRWRGRPRSKRVSKRARKSWPGPRWVKKGARS